MAGKIKSKDLTYSTDLPPFLQRLHAQKAGRGDQDRHERPLARPKREKVYDEEDEPTVVDESGELLSASEVKKLEHAGAAAEGAVVSGQDEGKADAEETDSGAINGVGKGRSAEQKITTGLVEATRKRKMGKVVGEDDIEENTEKASNSSGKPSQPTKKVAKKKAKPVKLAFDDEDG